LNIYILVDPADSIKKKSDFTAMAVIGLEKFQNYYLLDLIRDKLNLNQRWEKLRGLVLKWKPLKVGYEKYGKDSDIAHMNGKMIDENVVFQIEPLAGKEGKIERIKLLQSPFEYGQFLLPYAIFYTDVSGKDRELVSELIKDEYTKIPFAVHDDIMDCMARIKDPKFGAFFPINNEKEKEKKPELLWNWIYKSITRRGSYMGR